MAEDKTKNKDNPDGKKNDSSDGDDGKKTGTYSKEAYDAVVAESIGRKKKLEKAEADLKAIEDAKLTEAEKDKKRIKELEDENEGIKSSSKAKETDNLILRATVGKNFIDVDTASLLVKKELESEEEINEKTVGKVVDGIVKAKPFLISSDKITTPGPGNFSKNNMEGQKDPDAMFGEMIKEKI